MEERKRDLIERALGARAAERDPDLVPNAARLLAETGARAVAPEDPEYLHGLDGLPGSHPVVFLRGPWSRNGWRVAIVGSRRASPEGCALAFRLAADLAGEGVEILSGLAVGIDAAAHRGALSVSGKTGAVLGTGLDRCYPPEHAALQEEIAGSIGLLTERAPGTPVTRAAFASRNRLLAALSDAVVVVEGHGRSGSLITARHARSMNRPVGALPWSLWNEHGAAPHALLRSGDAVLVSGPGDVLSILPSGGAWPPSTLPLEGDLERAAPPRRRVRERPWVVASRPRPASRATDPLEARILGVLLERPQTVDEVAAAAGASIPETSATLLMLEMSGAVRREFGGRVRLLPRLRFATRPRS